MAALLAPIAGGIIASRGGTGDDISLAVPVVLAVMVAYLAGGYVAGCMAGYSTSWHGMMTAFFGLFVILAVILTGVAAARGYLGDVRIGGLDPASTWGVGPDVIGNALTFGAILGFLAAIFAGWLGGLLAPSRLLAARTVPVAPVVDAPVRHAVRPRRVATGRKVRAAENVNRIAGPGRMLGNSIAWRTP